MQVLGLTLHLCRSWLVHQELVAAFCRKTGPPSHFPLPSLRGIAHTCIGDNYPFSARTQSTTFYLKTFSLYCHYVSLCSRASGCDLHIKKISKRDLLPTHLQQRVDLQNQPTFISTTAQVCCSLSCLSPALPYAARTFHWSKTHNLPAVAQLP